MGDGGCCFFLPGAGGGSELAVDGRLGSGVEACLVGVGMGGGAWEGVVAD